MILARKNHFDPYNVFLAIAKIFLYNMKVVLWSRITFTGFPHRDKALKELHTEHTGSEQCVKLDL